MFKQTLTLSASNETLLSKFATDSIDEYYLIGILRLSRNEEFQWNKQRNFLSEGIRFFTDLSFTKRNYWFGFIWKWYVHMVKTDVVQNSCNVLRIHVKSQPSLLIKQNVVINFNDCVDCQSMYDGDHLKLQ